MNAKIFYFIILTALLTLSFLNCSGTNFGALSSQNNEEQKPAEEVYEDVPVDVTSVVEMPKIVTSIPDCQPNTMCRIEFKMQKALTLPISFKWHTDDDPASKWKTDILPPNVIWGIAGTHYIAAQGDLIFKAGETTKVIDVQNINQSASGIRLKVLLNNCAVGTGTYRCQLFF